MRAFHLDTIGSPYVLHLREHATPTPGPEQVLVRVRAASLNRRDVAIAAGTYPVPARVGIIPVSDGAGVVVAVGDQVKRAKVGDRITATYFRRRIGGGLTLDLLAEQYGCSLDGALADDWLIHDESVVAIPPHLSFEEAATLTCAGVTAWAALTSPHALLPGETVLTLGSGGVALFTMQLAKLFGARVIAVTSSDDKAARLGALGVDDVVSSASSPDWDAVVRNLTGGRGVDRVVETVGPVTLERSMRATRFGGQINLVGSFGTGALDPRAILRSGVTIAPVFVGSRATFEAMNAAMTRHQLRPVIDRVFPFTEATAAYHYLDSQQQVGKVVITGA